MPSRSQPRSTKRRAALPVPHPTSRTRCGSNAIRSSMSAAGYEGLALSYSVATAPNDRARARFSCMRSDWSSGIDLGSAEPRRLRCQRRLDVCSKPYRVGRLEPRGGHPNAARTGDAEPIPGEHTPATTLERGNRCILVRNRDPDVETGAAVGLDAAIGERRAQRLAAERIDGGDVRRGASCRPARSTSEPRGVAAGARPSPRRAGGGLRRARRWWHRRSSQQGGGRVRATSTPIADAPIAHGRAHRASGTAVL